MKKDACLAYPYFTSYYLSLIKCLIVPVGKWTPVLRIGPTPPPAKAASLKRPRVTTRQGMRKRKVLLDDTTVLHAEYDLFPNVSCSSYSLLFDVCVLVLILKPV